MESLIHNQTNAFLTNITHMSLPDNIRDRLVLGGLINVDNFDDFKED